jgi:hypothetical protein
MGVFGWRPVRRSLCATALAFTLISVEGAVLSSPAWAVTVLTSTETASLQTSLTAAIQAANGDKAAIEAAIAKAMQDALATYGSDAAGSIASAIISIAEAAGATEAEIGDGLGQASAAIAPTDLTAANAIASTVANEGKSGEVTAYAETVRRLGLESLALLAEKPPEPVGDPGLIGARNGSTFPNSGARDTNGCLNPSCTSL